MNRDKPSASHRYHTPSDSYFSGFTIVELLVVIVIIGILAAITMVSYTGVTQRATAAALQSDLTSNSTLLKMYYTEYGSYPTALDANKCPSTPSVDTKYCLKSSSGITLSYQPSSTSGTAANFSLYASKNTTYYRVSSDTGLTTASVSKVCPYGFIVVPGSSTYGTTDFCVMKYEAKADDNGDGLGDTNQTTGYNTWPSNTHAISATRKLVSTAQGYPVAYNSQNTATTAASSYTANCVSGCHLITEAEWMTIAQNVLGVASNWDNGSGTHIVGTGYIYSGHNDNSPVSALEASANDSDGYFGTGNNSSSGTNQRRTLTLSNGEVIWDLSGNVWDWTSGQITGSQPGLSGEVAYASKDWNNASLLQNGFPSNSMPASTGVSGVTWNSSQGIGKLYSNYGETTLRGYMRGGSWTGASFDGILTLDLSNMPTAGSWYAISFRVAQ